MAILAGKVEMSHSSFYDYYIIVFLIRQGHIIQSGLLSDFKNLDFVVPAEVGKIWNL